MHLNLYKSVAVVFCW